MPEGYKEEFDVPVIGSEDETPVEEPESAEPEEKTEQDTIESLATEMGWKPKTDFQGNEDDYVDAATYIRRSKDIQDTLRQHLKDNRKKMTSLEKGIEDLRIHNERVYKAEIARQKEQLEALRSQRKEAIEEGDVAAVEQIEQKMNQLNVEDKPQEQKVDPEEYQAFSSWLKTNTWYNLEGVTEGNKDLTQYADKLAELPEYQILPYPQRLKKIAVKVTEMFPEEFQPKNKKPANTAVESPSLRAAKKKHSARDLNDDQRDIMRNFVRNGIMSEQEYIDDLVKLGELS